MEAAFLELMPATINISRLSSEDQYGNNTYGSATEVRARPEQHMMERGRGQVPPDAFDDTPRSEWTFYVDYVTPEWSVQDKIVYGSYTLYITSVDIEYDEDGPHHLVLTANSKDES